MDFKTLRHGCPYLIENDEGLTCAILRNSHHLLTCECNQDVCGPLYWAQISMGMEIDCSKNLSLISS